jgi:TP901 family phage tail tape measure protein
MANVSTGAGAAAAAFSAEGADQASSSVKSLTGAMSSLKVTVLGLAGAFSTLAGLGIVGTIGGITAAFAGAVKQAADFEKQMRGVARTAELSEEQTEQLGDAILELSARTPTASAELAKIAEEAGRLGIAGSQNIQEFTNTIQQVAVATETGAQTAAQQLAKISNALGRSVSNVRPLADVINELSQTAPTSFGEISQAMRKAAAGISQSVRLSGENLAALTATITAAGAEAGRTGTRFRRLFEELALPDTQKAIAQTINEPLALVQKRLSTKGGVLPLIKDFAEELRGMENREAFLQEIFPTSALANLRRIITRTGQLEERMGSAATATGSVREEFKRSVNALIPQFNLLLSNFEKVFIEVGQGALNTLQQSVMRLTEALQTMDESTERELAAIAEGIANITVAIGNFTVKSIVRGFQSLQDVVGGTFEDFDKRVIDVLNNVKDTTVNVLNETAQVIGNVSDTIVDIVSPFKGVLKLIGRFGSELTALAGVWFLFSSGIGQAIIGLKTMQLAIKPVEALISETARGFREMAKMAGIVADPVEKTSQAFKEMSGNMETLTEPKIDNTGKNGLEALGLPATLVDDTKEAASVINNLKKKISQPGVTITTLFQRDADVVKNLPQALGTLRGALSKLEPATKREEKAVSNLRKSLIKLEDASNLARTEAAFQEDRTRTTNQALEESKKRFNETVKEGKDFGEMLGALSEKTKKANEELFSLPDFSVPDIDTELDDVLFGDEDPKKQGKKSVKQMMKGMSNQFKLQESQLQSTFKTIGKKIQGPLESAFEAAGNQFNELMGAMATGADVTSAQIRKAFVKNLVTKLNQQLVTSPIMNMLTGGGQSGGLLQTIGGGIADFFSGGTNIPKNFGAQAGMQSFITGKSEGVALAESLGIGGFASGGKFDSGLNIVGEKGPELMATESGGRVMSNREMRDALKDGNQNVEVNVINKSGEQVETQQRSQGGTNITDVIVGEVSKDIQQGGQTAQAMKQTFGVQRQGQRM